MKIKSWIVTVSIFVAIVVVGIFIVYPILQPKKILKIYQPSGINPLLVDSSDRKTMVDHTISNFKLINQNGDTVTNKITEDKIYVADFFFTTCQSICPKMSSSMAILQKKYSADNSIILLSHSVTPEMDSVPILAAYAKKFNVDSKKWQLLTGDKKEIYKLARKSYFVVLDEGDGGVQDFIHTENFVLIDKEKRIRGFYDGTSSVEIERLIGDIDILKNEYAK
jgi:protein SCO1